MAEKAHLKVLGDRRREWREEFEEEERSHRRRLLELEKKAAADVSGTDLHFCPLYIGTTAHSLPS